MIGTTILIAATLLRAGDSLPKASLILPSKNPILTPGSPFNFTVHIEGLDKERFRLNIYRFVPNMSESYRPIKWSQDKKNSQDYCAVDTEYATQVVGLGVEVYERDESTGLDTGKIDNLVEEYVSVASSHSRSKNGITVGEVKQFDVTSLTMMMQGLNGQLSNLGLISGTALAGSIGQFQGASATSSWLGFQAATQALPQIVTTAGAPVTNTLTTQNPTTNQVVSGAQNTITSPTGTTTNGATQQTTTNTSTGPIVATTQNGATNQVVTTQAPTAAPVVTAPSQLSNFSFAPSFGPGPQSTFQDQVDLTYQVFNLQMLLQGALSDRYFGVPKVGTDATIRQARYRTVVGIPVTLDPTSAFKGDAAEVEITISTDDADEGRPSLVGLMPMENSYNVAKMTQQANQVQLGANVSIFSLGAGGGNASQSVYLVRDNDTLAKIDSTENDPLSGPPSVRFGWEFRPVLGESSVRAGTRTLFASLALPVSMDNKWSGHIRVRTWWRKYDQNNRIVGDRVSGSFHQKDFQELDLAQGYLSEGQGGVSIYGASWQDAGDGKSVSVDVDGVNFISGTFVHAGSLTYTQPATLSMAPRSLSFTMPANLLGISDPYVVNPYGLAVRIRSKSSIQNPAFPFTVDKAAWKASTDGVNGTVTLHVYATGGPTAPILAGPADAPDPHIYSQPKSPFIRMLAMINGQAYGLEGNPLIVSTDPSPDSATTVPKITSILHSIAASQTAEARSFGIATEQAPKPMIPQGYTISFSVPITTLKAASIVKLLNPLSGEFSVSSCALVPPEAGEKQPQLSVIANNGMTAIMTLTIDKGWQEPFVLTIGSKVFSTSEVGNSRLTPVILPTQGSTVQNFSPYTFTIDNADLIGVQQALLVSRQKKDAASTALVEVVNSIGLAPTSVPTLSVIEPIHVQDETHVTVQGADLTAVIHVYYDDHELSFEPSGLNLLVKLDKTMTKTPGKKEIKLVFPGNKKVYVPVVVQP